MHLEFREASTESELRSLFDLRRNVFSMDPALRINDTGNDITAFDLQSIHFGAFKGNRAVAYLRMVQQTPTDLELCVKNMATEDLAPIPKGVSFPFEMYAPDQTWNKEFLNSLDGKKIGEAGKLAIDEDYRGTRVPKDFVQAFITHCNEKHGFDSGFGICTFRLERFYKRLGFYRANGSRPFIYNDLPEAIMLQFDRPYTHISYPEAMAFFKC
jgi:predicted GNAT family N-acyltransferase